MLELESASQFTEWVNEACDDPQVAKLLHASLTLFSTKGYLDTSVDDIVAMAHASKRTFYKHFPSKYDALHRCFQLVASKLHREVAEILDNDQLTVSEQIHAAVTYYFETLCVYHAPIARLLLVEVVGVSQEFEQVRLQYHREFSRTIQRSITRGIRLGQFTKVDPVLTSYVIVGAVNEVLVRLIEGESEVEVERVVNFLTASMARMMGAAGSL